MKTTSKNESSWENNQSWSVKRKGKNSGLLGFKDKMANQRSEIKFAGNPHTSLSRHDGVFPSPRTHRDKPQNVVGMHVAKAQEKPLSDCKPPSKSDPRPLLSVPRIAKYCNIPHNDAQGEEGVVSRDLTLVAVHVAIRHGDRAPLVQLANDKTGLEHLSCLLDVSQFNYVPKLDSYLQVMVAAQAESPPPFPRFSRWSMYPDQPDCIEGQLTGQGGIQQVLSGLHLSQRYGQSPHHLPLSSERISVHSTMTSRTYQSALAFLYGLLPTFDPKQISMGVSSNVFFCDVEKAPGSVCACPGLDQYKYLAVDKCRADPSVRQASKKFTSSAAVTIAEILGVGVSDLPSSDAVMDALSKFSCHSIPPPCVTTYPSASNKTDKTCPPTLNCINATTLEETWSSVDAISKCLHNNSDFKKFAILSTQGMLLRIAQSFKRASLLESNIKPNENSAEPLVTLYSGHDNTLTPLLVALGLEENVWPAYASRLVFELYRRGDGKSAPHYIRILFNGKPVTSQASFCRSGSILSGGEDLCELERFVGHVNNLKVQQFCSALRSAAISKRKNIKI